MNKRSSSSLEEEEEEEEEEEVIREKTKRKYILYVYAKENASMQKELTIVCCAFFGLGGLALLLDALLQMDMEQ